MTQAAAAKAGGDNASSQNSSLPNSTNAFGFSIHVANPVRASAAIQFVLARPAPAQLDIYDIAGRHVRSVLDQRLEAGAHQRLWDGRDGKGVSVVNGIYFVVLRSGQETLRQKITLIR